MMLCGPYQFFRDSDCPERERERERDRHRQTDRQTDREERERERKWGFRAKSFWFLE